eukprot:COSAG02_NODE_328_length_24547_cov_4.124141_19_plen_73_part_00
MDPLAPCILGGGVTHSKRYECIHFKGAENLVCSAWIYSLPIHLQDTVPPQTRLNPRPSNHQQNPCSALRVIL